MVFFSKRDEVEQNDDDDINASRITSFAGMQAVSSPPAKFFCFLLLPSR